MARQHRQPQQWLITVGRKRDHLELFRCMVLTLPAARFRDYSLEITGSSFLRQAGTIASGVPARICLPN